nr:MAG TPA: hypothetical protein [Caudoviricetes sp.]
MVIGILHPRIWAADAGRDCGVSKGWVRLQNGGRL